MSWTNREFEKLKLIYLTTPQGDLAREFPGHSVRSIIDTANRIGLRKGRASKLDTMRKYREIAARHVPTFNFGGAR